jgi:adenylate cyclase
MPVTPKPPTTGSLYRALIFVACAPLLPQVLGSIFNIWYNIAVIGPLLDTARLKDCFTHTVIVFNLVVYPIAIGLWLWLVGSLLPAMREAVAHSVAAPSPLLERARRRVINLPWMGSALAGFSWLLCIPVFLGALIATGEPIKDALYFHLPISFLVSGLISLTHSFFLIEMQSHRRLLPILFHNTPAHAVPGTWKLSLRGRGLLWIISAGICPISSLLLLSFAPKNPTTDPAWFALFVGSVGIAFGLLSAMMIERLVGEPIDLLSNAVRDVAAGRFDTQMSLQRPDEFGLLISEFNRMIRELQEKEKLRETFGLHVGDQVAKRILARDPGLSGTEENITVMFCDIRNFTARCALLGPERTVSLLNAFFGVMVRIVEEHNGGMINQFTGDGFMAFFGADGHPPQHADAALKTGREMIAALANFNAGMTAKEPDFDPLAIGIGLHTGPAVVGSIGSPKRMTFTAIGSTTNIAARVESLTKTLGHPILITQATREALSEKPPLVELPAQQVKGVERPLAVFAPRD